ncbi:MAG TPA: ABC transporter permease [Candidatus Cloacimonadota bacterium]|nr:ABC transporter permease [Candidatus Cloacimonadota bacterium]HQL14933.1 ABC transporter permease [Candidatus Cloacimonadota bacterium]
MAISLRESLEIGLSDIWMRKVRTLVTILGIILGVMSIMVVLAIINSMNRSTLEWMNQRGGTNKIEIHRNWNLDRKDWSMAKFSLQELQYIQSLIPEATAYTPIASDRSTGISIGELYFKANISGVYPDFVKVEEWKPAQGRFINYYDLNNNNNVIVVGSKVASELFGNKNPIGEKVTVEGQVLEVIGVMEEKKWEESGSQQFGNMLDYMNKRAFIPLTTFVHKIAPNQEIDQINVQAVNSTEALKLQKKLNGILLNLKQGKKLFEVSSAQEMIDQMKQNSMLFTTIFILIAVVSLLVGGIVIMNIMLASVQERTREIGVRLAIGARRIDIFLQFMVQTVLITALGGVVGIIFGFSILNLVGKYLDLKLVASMNMIYVALLVSVGVGLIFGIMPAVRAANLNPVTALREE